MKLIHPLTMGTDPTYRNKNGSLCYPCKGSIERPGVEPSNTYHPAQVAYLFAIKRYTGRFIVDVGHLPEGLRNL